MRWSRAKGKARPPARAKEARAAAARRRKKVGGCVRAGSAKADTWMSCARGSKLPDKLRNPELRTLGSKIRSKRQHRSRRAAARAKEETRAAARAKDKESSPDIATGVAAGVTEVSLAGS